MTRRAFGAGALVASVLPLAAGAQASVAKAADPLWFVHPELRDAARQMQAMNFPVMSDATLPTMRSAGLQWARPVLPSVSVATRTVPVPGGAPDVTLYVINARPGASRPGILHTHGGGYVGGLAKSGIRELQEIAAALDRAIVTVEYRLAPETRWSGSTEDTYAGLRWLHAHAAELGVDRARIAVMGESAGGEHAALLAIRARDRGEVPLAFQLLDAPMLDDRTGSTRAVPAPIGALSWTAEANRYGWRSFLGQEPSSSRVPVAAVPARTADLHGLPPTFIGVGSIDLFVQEDMDYARQLIEAGVMTELAIVPGAFHGFNGIAADTLVAKGYNTAKLEALRRALSVG